jgi:hypothetical protein
MDKVKNAIEKLTIAEDGEIKNLDDFRNKISSLNLDLKQYRDVLIDAMKAADLSDEEIRQLIAQLQGAKTEVEATKGAFAG